MDDLKLFDAQIRVPDTGDVGLIDSHASEALTLRASQAETIVHDPTLVELWTPAGVLLGFQITLFYWRLEREVSVGDEGHITWLAPADYLGIAGTIIFVLGVFLLPLAGFAGATIAGSALGLGTLLFVGHFLGLCGHYEVFDATKPRSFVYFPRQEKIIVSLAVLAAVLYLVALFR